MFKILVVEDEAMNREMLARRLVLQGYDIIVAGDGAAAIGLARREQPNLIVMDMGLPVLNGWQATHRLKTNEDTAGIPIIALTAYAMSEDRLRCFNIGCDEYESKPVNFDRLLPKIAEMLSHPPQN